VMFPHTKKARGRSMATGSGTAAGSKPPSEAIGHADAPAFFWLPASGVFLLAMVT
jgi:hypothetical protein